MHLFSNKNKKATILEKLIFSSWVLPLGGGFSIAKPQITFAVLHVRRLDCTRKCMEAIFATANVPFKVVLLVQGKQSKQAMRYFQTLEQNTNVRLVYLPKNIGGSKGRNMSIELADSPLIMTLDNDCYLQHGWLEPVLVLLKDPKIITVSIPLYNKQSQLQTLGGVISIHKGVLTDKSPEISEMHWDKGYVKVDTQPEGCMVFRDSVKHLVKWDTAYWVGFAGLDMNFTLNEITRRNGFIRVVSLRSKAQHYQVGPDLVYKRMRMSYSEFVKSYKRFCGKWGVRLPTKKHLKYRNLFPILAYLPTAVVDAARRVRRKPPLIWLWKPKVP